MNEIAARTSSNATPSKSTVKQRQTIETEAKTLQKGMHDEKNPMRISSMELPKLQKKTTCCQYLKLAKTNQK
jgi:hypothetical protein